jgi:hypothetical protein
MDRARAEEIQRAARTGVWYGPVTPAEIGELADAMLAQIKHAEGVARAEAYLRSRGCLRCLCDAAPGADGQAWIGGVPHACKRSNDAST